MNSKNILITDSISSEGFCRLREEVNFQKLTEEEAKCVLHNTSFVFSAVHKGEYVGVIRILSDKVTDAYITDVIVKPEYQGYGIGKMLVAKAVEHLKEYKLNGLNIACCLYANRYKEKFYEKNGFEKLSNEKYGYGMIKEI